MGTAFARTRVVSVMATILMSAAVSQTSHAASSEVTAAPPTVPVASPAASAASPADQVFQFSFSAAYDQWPDGSKTNPTAYLWIPEKCRRVRGLLILCNNVPEHRLVGHPAIRKAAADNDLAIVWCAPSFMNFRKDKDKGTDNAREYGHITTSLQRLLDGLAETSGYPEIATAPWLPIGESGHLLMVSALVEAKPERCIAGVWLKNNHFPPTNRTVPALVVYGTAQEWSQDKTDYRTKWNDVGKTYDNVLKSLKAAPQWPLTYVIDGTSGHFDCSERITVYLAHYIDRVAEARLTDRDASFSPGPVKPVRLDTGFLADLPLPGRGKGTITAYADAPADDRAKPWYFDRAAADEARAIADIDWAARSQLIGFLGADGKPLPFDFNGIVNLKSVQWEEDERTFRIRPVLLDTLPPNFVGAGEPLARTPGVPALEWLCGSLELLDAGTPDATGAYRLRVSLDRTWRIATYLAARQPGADGIRPVVQPLAVDMLALRNATGKPQKITFSPIADVPAGTASVPLSATSDAGLPVEFFVVAGPAVVRDGKLVLTPLPPRTKFPVTVTVAAWQWGRSREPQVRTAEVVRQSFRLLAPAADH